MRDILNCPNCGAPITSDHCDYCGAQFYDFAKVNLNEPSFVKFDMGNRTVMLKVQIYDIGCSYYDEGVSFYADNTIHNAVTARGIKDIRVNFKVLPFDGPIGPKTLAIMERKMQ